MCIIVQWPWVELSSYKMGWWFHNTRYAWGFVRWVFRWMWWRLYGRRKRQQRILEGWVPAIDSRFHLALTSGPWFGVCEGDYFMSIEPFYSSCPETMTCSEKRKDVKRSEDGREIKENQREWSLTTHKHTHTTQHTHNYIRQTKHTFKIMTFFKKSVYVLSYKTSQAHVFAISC